MNFQDIKEKKNTDGKQITFVSSTIFESVKSLLLVVAKLGRRVVRVPRGRHCCRVRSMVHQRPRGSVVSPVTPVMATTSVVVVRNGVWQRASAARVVVLLRNRRQRLPVRCPVRGYEWWGSLYLRAHERHRTILKEEIQTATNKLGQMINPK